MPRVIELTTQPERTDSIVEQLSGLDGIVGVAVNRDGSVSPPGDVIRVNATNLGARKLALVVGEPSASGVMALTSSEPLAMVAPDYEHYLDNEWSEGSWTDVAGHLREESNPEPNILLLMFLSGAIAAIGLSTDAIHIVIGAMVVAPGFEPFMRVPFALIAGPLRTLKQAVVAVLGGFAVMAIGGGLSYRLLRGLGGADDPLMSLVLVRYWSSITVTTFAIATVAGLAGAITVTADRSVFTAGVLITVALVPGITLFGMGLAAGEAEVAVDGLRQWTVNGAIALLTSAVVVGLKHQFHRKVRSQ